MQVAIPQSTHRPSLFELPSSTVVSRLVPLASHNLSHLVFFFIGHHCCCDTLPYYLFPIDHHGSQFSRDRKSVV